MISAANVTIQFGEKPLFEDVSVKFANGRTATNSTAVRIN